MKNKFLPILTIAFLLGVVNASAEIKYRYINDSAVYNKSYQLDLNLDGNIDFAFNIDSLPNFYLADVTVFGSDSIVDVSNHGYIEPIDPGVIIQAKSNWSNFSQNNHLGILGTFSTDNFGGKGNKYIGLQIQAGGLIYYGWVQVSLNVNRTRLIIIDAAYNAIAGTAIPAGQKFTNAIHDINANTPFNLVQTGNKFTINSDAERGQNGNLTVMDMTGKIVYHITLKEPENSLALNEFSPGIYCIVIELKGCYYQRKIFIGE